MSVFSVIREAASLPGISVRKGTRDLANARKRNYREFQYGPDKNQRVLVYQPEVLKHPQVVIFLHGGSYIQGSPDDLGVAADVFCKSGYRFMSVGYRLARKHPFPSQVEDAFRGYAVALKILELLDEERGVEHVVPPIIVGGLSSGAHLAALLGYSWELSEGYGFDTTDIVGVISLAGFVDMRDTFGKYRSGLFKGLTTLPDWDSMRKYSPIDIIDEYAEARYLAIHGRKDGVAPYRSQVDFVGKLNVLDEQRRSHIRSAEPQREWQSWSETSEAQNVKEQATLYALKGGHVELTSGIFTGGKKQNRALRAIFRWLEQFDQAPAKPAHPVLLGGDLDRRTWVDEVYETQQIDKGEVEAGLNRLNADDEMDDTIRIEKKEKEGASHE